MKRYIFLFILIVFSCPVLISFGSDHNRREWEAENFKIIEINNNVINVIYRGNSTKYQFDFNIYEINPNPSMPIILVVTYNQSEVEEAENELEAAMPPKFMTCKTFIIDIPTGIKYTYEESCAAAITNIWSPNGNYALNGLGYYIVKTDNVISNLKGVDVPKIHIIGNDPGCIGMVEADSWDWVSNAVLFFSGGACGTFLDCLFDVSTKELETYCSQYQKPGYGCPEHSFKPASELKKRISQLRGSAEPGAPLDVDSVQLHPSQ
jgi:hypothetical protein